jgi:hypothetical protein
MDFDELIASYDGCMAEFKQLFRGSAVFVPEVFTFASSHLYRDSIFPKFETCKAFYCSILRAVSQGFHNTDHRVEILAFYA